MTSQPDTSMKPDVAQRKPFGQRDDVQRAKTVTRVVRTPVKVLDVAAFQSFAD